jgi:ABC-type nickel/cobalt efflux system permease component RcnA
MVSQRCLWRSTRFGMYVEVKTYPSPRHEGNILAAEHSSTHCYISTTRNWVRDSRYRRLYSGQYKQQSLRGGWVGPRAGLDVSRDRKLFTTAGTRSPYSSRYTDYATHTHTHTHTRTHKHTQTQTHTQTHTHAQTHTQTHNVYTYTNILRGYVLRNASLSDIVVMRTCTYKNLDIIAYYTPRLYGIAYCS